MTRPAPALLRVAGLSVRFDSRDGVVRAVEGVSFEVRPGETLALVGESGSGKSVTALAVMGLIPTPPGHVAADRIDWRGRDLLTVGEPARRRVRGAEIAMAFQDPASALNPVRSIGAQIAEVIRLHAGAGRRGACRGAIALLERVGMAGAAHRAYPHELSAGMRQRAMLAMAIAGAPDLLIADEPTSALDVTVQAQVLALLRDLRRETGVAILLVTHDFGVVAAVADRVMVMYAGRLVEVGPTEAIFRRPAHPYTRALLAARPRLDTRPGQRVAPIPGHPPSPLETPAGCPFHPRCPLTEARCRTQAPELRPLTPEHEAACHLAERPG